MADSPNLWDAFTAAIKAGVNPPFDINGGSILDQVDSTGAVWRRVHRGRTTPNRAGESPPPGYFLLGLEIESEAGCYNGEAGQDGLYRIHCWARTPDDARRLYRWLKGLLHDVPLTVEGYQPVTGVLSKSGPIADQDGAAYQVEASYQAEPFEVVV